MQKGQAILQTVLSALFSTVIILLHCFCGCRKQDLYISSGLEVIYVSIFSPFSVLLYVYFLYNQNYFPFVKREAHVKHYRGGEVNRTYDAFCFVFL